MTIEQKEEYWNGVLDEQKASGKSVAQFCREHGLAAWKFYYWRNRQGRQSSPSGFMEVIIDEVPIKSGVSLRLGQVNVDLDRDFDTACLHRLLQTLGLADA